MSTASVSSRTFRSQPAFRGFATNQADRPAASQDDIAENLNIHDLQSPLDVLPMTRNSRLWFIPEQLTLPPRNQCGPSHSKRKPSNHVPRPRNAFILFRSHFHSMQVLPSHLDFCKDHRQISRIVSFVWAGLPAAEKQLFFQLSEDELRIHQRNFPSFSLAPSKSSKSKALKDIDIPTKEKEIRLNPEELQCKQIAELVLSGLQGDELSARVEEVVAGYIARKHAQQSPKVKSGSTSKARTAAPRIKGQTRTVVSRVAAPRFPRPKEQRKTSKQSQPKLRSSTSISKGGKASLVSNLPPSPPPRRRCVPLSFTQYLSDEEEEYEPLETQVVDFARGTTPPLSIFAEDVMPPPLSDSDDSSASFTSRSFESVLSEEGAMSVPPESSIGDPTISWTEEEHWNHLFDEEEDRFDSMEIVDSAPFAEFGVHLRPVGDVDLYEQLEREFFAERARTPFDPDHTFSSSSFGLHWETPWFDPFQVDYEILDSEESVEPITVSLSDLSPRRRR